MLDNFHRNILFFAINAKMLLTTAAIVKLIVEIYTRDQILMMLQISLLPKDTTVTELIITTILPINAMRFLRSSLLIDQKQNFIDKNIRSSFVWW